MNVHAPETIEQACAMLRQHAGDLVPMAGATDLLVHWPGKQRDHDRSYLDLSGVSELRTLTWESDALKLGALITYWDVLRDPQAAREFPMLIEAARQVGAVQIQTRGTWAGNIANGSPAADGVPVLMALDASVTLVSATGARSVPLADYYTGYRASVRRPDELIASITVPRRSYDFTAFYKVGPRRAQAITKVGVAVSNTSSAGTDRWRVVANSVAPTVCRCRRVESLLDAVGGRPITAPSGFVPALQADVAPIDDIRSTAEYRLTVLARLLYHGLKGRTPSVA